MAEPKRPHVEDVYSILDEEDEATLAAIDRGMKAADEGRVVSAEEVRRRIATVAYKILDTDEALTDLELLIDYIRADNPSAAERFGTALLNHVELLRDFPRIRTACLHAFRSPKNLPFSGSCLLPSSRG